MTDFILLTREEDICKERIAEEARNAGCRVFAYTWEEMVKTLNPKIEWRLGESAVLCARVPYDYVQGISYESILRIVLREFKFVKILDESICRLSYEQHEDKLFQSYIFDKVGVPYAKIELLGNVENWQYPIIAKTRVSGRSRGNYILRNKSELDELNGATSGKFIFQKFRSLIADYRVLILGNEVLSIVNRKVTIHDDGRVGVKVFEPIAKISEEIINECLEVKNKLGLDFVGFDVGMEEGRSHFFIEYNMYPYFVATERETGINVGRKLVDFLLKY